MATDTQQNLVRASAGLGQPLRVPIFRHLLIADLVSDIGTFMQNVGAAWLMVLLRAGPGYVALIPTAASLAYFLLALPAGSAGDIFDRRRLILYTEAWTGGERATVGSYLENRCANRWPPRVRLFRRRAR